MYVNAIDIAFWSDKALIGQWHHEDVEHRKSDPFHHQILAAGEDYQDAVRVLLSNIRSMNLEFPEAVVTTLMEEAAAYDQAEGSHSQPVYVGIITGTVH